MPKRNTQFTIEQKPGPWAMSVTVRSIDGDVSVNHQWTWIGWLLQWFLPKPFVKVVRARELVLGTKRK